MPLLFTVEVFLFFADERVIWMRYRCAYVSEGNGIVEWCHHTIKRIAARMWCLIQEAVCWYNAMAKDDEIPSSVPANGIYQYEQCVKGVDSKLSTFRGKRNPYQVGEIVWAKIPNVWCITRFSKEYVNGMISLQTLLINGTPHHVKDLCWRDISNITEDN